MDGYIRKQLNFKYFGGYIRFFESYRRYYITGIDATSLDLSIWISNMKLQHTTPYNIYFAVDIYDPGPQTTYTMILFHGKTNDKINGFTLPRRIYSFGGLKIVYDIKIVAWNSETPDNHEFFFWSGLDSNQYISLLS